MITHMLGAVMMAAVLITATVIPGPSALAAVETHQSSTTTTSTSTPPPPVEPVATTTTEHTEIHTTTEKPEKSHSLLGSLFIFVGNVVAFPFRLVGGVFDAIF